MLERSYAILGFGVTGQSAARHLLARDCSVVVCDTRPAPEKISDEFSDLPIRWNCTSWPDLAVTDALLSPGISMRSCLVQGARDAGVNLLSDIDLFFEHARAPVIGITGTNGKSTVTSLVGHMLNYASINCGVGGNLGDAALDILDDASAAYVLELSSFQLERSGDLPLRAATILNVSADHIDMHGDMSGYIAAKQRIYATADLVVFNREDSVSRPLGAIKDGARQVSFGLNDPGSGPDWGLVKRDGRRWLARGSTPVLPADELPLLGAHNQANALAACALVADMLDTTQIAEGLRSFQGLEHRYQLVCRAGGVNFVNDSKATNLGATQAALAGLPALDQVLLIAGGDAKGVDLSPLGDLLPGRVRKVFCIGVHGDHVGEVAQRVGVEFHRCADLSEAVVEAAGVSAPGDTVLLSPACSSLDMFNNFAERGRQFVKAVQRIAPVMQEAED